MSGQDTIQQIIYKPIGVFHTSFTPETGAPRQGIMMRILLTIQLFLSRHG